MWLVILTINAKEPHYLSKPGLGRIFALKSRCLDYYKGWKKFAILFWLHTCLLGSQFLRGMIKLTIISKNEDIKGCEEEKDCFASERMGAVLGNRDWFLYFRERQQVWEMKLTMPRKTALDHELVIIFMSRNKIIKPYILVKDCKERALHTHGFPLDYSV